MLSEIAVCEETANRARRTKARDSTRASMLEPIATNEHSATYAEICIPVPGGHIAGRWYGDQLQRPILAIHGWLDNCGSFAKLAPLLAPQRSLLCIDLPGHGHSTHLPTGIIYDMMSFVRAIRRLMLIYNWPKVSLMGHSMGAAISFTFAALYPQCVDMIISLDYIKIMYMSEDITLNAIHFSIEQTIKHNQQSQLPTHMHEPPTYSYDQLVQLLHEGSLNSVDLDNCPYILERNISRSRKYPDKYYFSRDSRLKRIFIFNPNAALTAAMVQRITSTKVPHLLLKGGATADMNSISNEAIDLVQAQNPNFEQHVIPNGTHHLHLNNAEEVGAHIIRFLKKHKLNGDVRVSEASENGNQAKSKVKKSKL